MESLVHYSNPCHAPSMLGALNEQRLRGQLCDTVLLVGDQRYQAHRSVLASSSEYFQSLFSRMDAADAITLTLKVIHLDFCEPDAFEIVLNYIYSSSLFVDKGSLAAIQELGYSLGIPFLTNIAATRPHASYRISRKRLSFSEEDENDGQARSVIVRRVWGDASVPSRSNYQRKTSERLSSPHSTREQSQQTRPPSLHNSHHESVKNPESTAIKSDETSMDSERKSIYPYASILKGKASHAMSARPQLTSSVSFSDADIQHIRLQSGLNVVTKEEEEEPLYHLKGPFQGQAGEPSQTIDRSGPLIKSLLRRSLSMDSPVPVFSPTLELKELHSREQSVVKMAAMATGQESSEYNCSPKISPPPVLRSKCHSRYKEEEDTQVGGEVHVKAEPSSPLADPVEIIRITVGDSLAKDFQSNYDHSSRLDLSPAGKRKTRADNRRYPFKKTRGMNDHLPLDDINVSDSAPQNATTADDRDDDDAEQLRQNKVFRCWSCLKVFRSSAGLHRHVNMYHNPEKPYACDICHKRFHTNFKVWTHCQTQHGVVQNPASSSSSSVLDEKFQKKLIDIVREREIKKALLWKLKRNKQGLQTPALTKKRSRTNFICPYCGKGFLFQSQYRQHLRTHPTEKADQETERESILIQKQDEIVEQKENTDVEVYSCRLCSVKLSSLFEQGDHERGCRHATVCPYCGLRFSSPVVKKDHEVHCKYKKLTCLECMRTFKSSFSIWRHQVEVHNHNMMTVKDQMNLRHQEENNGEENDLLGQEHYSHHEPIAPGSSREDTVYSDSSGPPLFDSEDSSSFVPEDLSMGKLVVKEEPVEESVSERENTESSATEESGVWPCEKCGKLFSSHKDLERHQELLCHIKPFICHICNKAFRTNFRLWSHFQSHMSTADEAGAREGVERHPSSPSPSPPPTPQTSGRPAPQVAPLKPAQKGPVAAVVAEEPSSPDPGSSSVTTTKRPEVERQHSSHSPLSRSNSVENPAGPQESDTLFYHAPPLSALTFKRQYMCKLCHRTFKTAFSLWSHEQSHSL